MRTLVLVCAMLLGSLGGTAALAQERTRLAFVDVRHLLDNAPQIAAGREALDQEFRPRNDAILEDESRLIAMEQSLSGDLTLSEAQQSDLVRDINTLRRSINRRKEDLREEIKFRRDQLARPVEETIEVIIRELAQEEGYDLIIASGSTVMYHNPAIEITETVLQRLREEFNADQRELAQP